MATTTARRKAKPYQVASIGLAGFEFGEYGPRQGAGLIIEWTTVDPFEYCELRIGINRKGRPVIACDVTEEAKIRAVLRAAAPELAAYFARVINDMGGIDTTTA